MRVPKKAVGCVVTIDWTEQQSIGLLVEAETDCKFVKIFDLEAQELRTVDRSQVIDIGKRITVGSVV